jgi:hypothetical protein
MLKILTLTTFATLLLIFNLGETALAQFKGTASQPGVYRGMRPPKTCAANGGQRAYDVRNCSASNCKPQGGSSKQK